MAEAEDTKNECIGLSIEYLQEASRMLRLLAHPYRLKIIELLKNEPEGMAVNALVRELGIHQSAVSQHLSSMQRAGILKGSRHGKEVWYTIDSDKPLKVLNCIKSGRKQQ